MGYGLAGVLVILSPSLGRAAPSGRYRPLLPADALDNGCYPLPPGVSIDFPYQVRTDEDLYLRPLRRLVLQYDEVEAVAVRDSLIATFMRAGFRERRSAGSSTSIVLRFVKEDQHLVTITITPLPRLAPGDLVRGTVEMLLPRVERQSNDPVCFDRFSTKRFAAWQPHR